MRQPIMWLVKGMAMGAANVIPGVSGGTIAFITGIYQRLIDALKSFDIQAIRLLLVFDFKTFAAKTDIRFLFWLFFGVAVSILSLAKVLEWSFINYESLTLAFFFGLILASIIGVGRQIETWNVPVLVSFVAGCAIAASIAFLPPAQPNGNLLYIILCGVVAVCSMILPGLSGSYILLLMGNYILVLQAVSSFDFGILMPLLIGCAVGLVLFSRLLSYLFARFKDQTVALLTGFVAGSLLIIWPWKKTEYLVLDGGKEKATGYIWLLPEFNALFLVALLLAIIGFFIVWLMDRRSATA